MKTHVMILCILMNALLFFAAGCSRGGGGGVAATPENATVGFFIDSPVEGLQYRTPSWSGFTDARGGFYYQPGEQVTFSIGDVILGRTTAKGIITPVDFGGTNQTTSNTKVINIARLLMSLDQDRTPGNGISISVNVRDALKGISVDLTDPALDNSAGIQEMFRRLNGLGIYPEELTRLVSAEEAQIHLENTVNQIAAEAEEEQQALANLKLNAFIASPGGNIIMVQGQSLSLLGTVFGGKTPYAYSWNFEGQQAFSSDKDYGSMTFTTIESYLLHFTVKDGAGDTREDSRLITVLDKDAQDETYKEISIPSVSITSPPDGSTFKVGEPPVEFIALLYNEADFPLIYGWTLGSVPGNSFVSRSSTVTKYARGTYVLTQGITLTSPGTYYISILVKDTNPSGAYPDTHADSIRITVQ